MSVEDRLRDDLRSLPLPALPVPDGIADRAVAGARRQARIRAVAVAGLAALVVASAAPVLRVTLSASGGKGVGTSTCEGPAPLPARPPAQAWEYFDPLRYEIDASSVSGYRVHRYETSTYYQVLELTDPARTRPVTVTLYATHGAPEIDLTAADPAGLVNGEPAYWLPAQSYTGEHHRKGLAWQWSPGAWVLVQVAALGPDGATPDADADPIGLRAIATYVASALSFGGATPVSSPFSMTVPACNRVGGTISVFDTSLDGSLLARFGLSFETEHTVESTSPLRSYTTIARGIGVDARWTSTAQDKPGLVTSTVDGHPAALGDCPSADQCFTDGTIYYVDGFALKLRGAPGVSLLDLYESIQIHAGATDDPSTWGPPIR